MKNLENGLDEDMPHGMPYDLKVPSDDSVGREPNICSFGSFSF